MGSGEESEGGSGGTTPLGIRLGFAELFPPPCRNMTEMMTTVSLQIVGIIEPLIQHADWFFPGGRLCPAPGEGRGGRRRGC